MNIHQNKNKIPNRNDRRPNNSSPEKTLIVRTLNCTLGKNTLCWGK